MRLRLRWFALTLICGVVPVAFPGAAPADTVTVGQTVAANELCSSDGVFFQTAVSSGASYTVPSGNWTITSWSADGGVWGGQMSLVVLRPSSTPGAFDVVGESALETLQTLPAGQVNTFATNVSVEGGDIVGIWVGGPTACAAGIPSATDTFAFVFTSPEPPVGTALTGLSSGAFSRINVAATLESRPSMPTSRRDCMDGGWESFAAFKNEGDCVSFVATGGTNPPGAPDQ